MGEDVICFMTNKKLYRVRNVVVTEDYDKGEGTIEGDLISEIDIPNFENTDS